MGPNVAISVNGAAYQSVYTGDAVNMTLAGGPGDNTFNIPAFLNSDGIRSPFRWSTPTTTR